MKVKIKKKELQVTSKQLDKYKMQIEVQEQKKHEIFKR